VGLSVFLSVFCFLAVRVGLWFFFCTFANKKITYTILLLLVCYSDFLPWLQAAEKALRAAHLSHDRDRMPSYQTTDLSQLAVGLADAELSAAVTRLTALLRDADYLRYPHRHTSPLVPRDVIGSATNVAPAIALTTCLIELCQLFIRRQ